MSKFFAALPTFHIKSLNIFFRHFLYYFYYFSTLRTKPCVIIEKGSTKFVSLKKLHQNWSYQEVCRIQVIGGTIFAIIVVCIFVIPLCLPDKNFYAKSRLEYTCPFSPEQCLGVPSSVNTYIMGNFKGKDQIRALLQVSRSLALLKSSFSENYSLDRNNITDIMRKILLSIECLSLNLPNTYLRNFRKLKDLQFVTQRQIELYLNATETFSGESIKLTKQSDIRKTCEFPLTLKSLRRLEKHQNFSNSSCLSNRNSTLVIFTGLGYDLSFAVQSLNKVKQIITENQSLNFEGGIHFLGSYKKFSNIGFFAKLVSQYLKHLQQNKSSSIQRTDIYLMMEYILSFNNGITLNQIGNLKKQDLQEFYKFYMKKVVTQFLVNESTFDLQKSKNLTLQEINSGKEVVILGYGQGSIYVNKVYKLLSDIEKKSISLVYFAPLANGMADESNNYVTSSNDKVVSLITNQSLINKNILTPLPANAPDININSQNSFGMNHELFDYLTTYKEKLIQLIKSAKSRTYQPINAWGNGPLVVTLKWSQQADLDLHIYEPGNNHVYWRSKIGQNGYLDRDGLLDSQQQHYYTSCTMETGIYEFRINYYSGNGIVRTSIELKAGSLEDRKQLDIEEPLGNRGNGNPPYLVWKVMVVKDSDGIYKFSIQN